MKAIALFVFFAAVFAMALAAPAAEDEKQDEKSASGDLEGSESAYLGYGYPGVYGHAGYRYAGYGLPYGGYYSYAGYPAYQHAYGGLRYW